MAYFDRYYFNQLFEDFVFPDGTSMQWESVSWLQKRFMKWFNQERLKHVLTFPVESLSLLNDGEKFLDEEWADFAAEMYAEGHSFFTYTSDSVDSLASCCFSGDTKILAKCSNGVFLNIPIADLHNMKWANKKNLTVYHNGSWVPAKTIELPGRKMYSVETSNKKFVKATDNHLWPTLEGLKRTDELTTNDWLMFNTRELDAVPEKDRHLSYNQGFLIGMYLGDGSIEIKDGKYFTTHFSLNEDKYKSCIETMNYALKDCDIDQTFTLGEEYNNVYPVSLYNKNLPAFIEEYVQLGYANEKRLTPEVFVQNATFRKGILDGFYATDGGNSNRIYTTSEDLAHDIEALCATLGINTIIDKSDRTDEPVVIRGNSYKRNYPLWCIRWYSSKNKRSMGDVFKVVNNSVYFRITNIEEIEPEEKVYCFECKNQDEPYFTLPNGMITHNCRLRNGITENQFSYTLGAGGISTGSKCVVTMDVNRLVQDAVINNSYGQLKTHEETAEYMRDDANLAEYLGYISEAVSAQTKRIHKYLLAFNENLLELRDKHMITIYDAGFIAPEKQYLTCGINGFTEAAEYLGIKVAADSDEYKMFAEAVLKPIYEANKAAKTKDVMFNTEYVPAENLGVKFAKWDKKSGYFVPRDCYNSYFYIVEDEKTNPLDKFKLHGKAFTQYLDGGSALHCNLDEHLSKEQYKFVLNYAIKTGCNYFTFNIPNTICNDCGYISKHKLDKCPKCGSDNLDYATRVIGYLTRVSKWSKERQEEHKRRYYARGTE